MSTGIGKTVYNGKVTGDRGNQPAMIQVLQDLTTNTGGHGYSQPTEAYKTSATASTKAIDPKTDQPSGWSQIVVGDDPYAPRR